MSVSMSVMIATMTTTVSMSVMIATMKTAPKVVVFYYMFY